MMHAQPAKSRHPPILIPFRTLGSDFAWRSSIPRAGPAPRATATGTRRSERRPELSNRGQLLASMSSIRSKKRTVALDLPSDALDWLESMAQEHSLPDKSKAARCCVNCAALTNMNLDGEEEGADDAREASMQNVGIELATEQVEWLENRAGASANDSEGIQKISVVMQRILHSCRNADKEEEVFGVIRCKSKVAICEGAQDAVGVLEKKYGAAKVEEEISLP